jgi:WD40 repeat protein
MYVWDAATGLVKDSETFGQPITSLAMARDGQTVAVALANREGVVCLWDPATRRVRGELRGHTDRVTCVAFSPDGKHLLTASRDHTAKLWTDTGGLVRTYRGHVAGVETAAFALEGQKIITAGSDKTAMLWKMDTDPQCEVLTDTPTSGSVRSLAFTPGNDRLIGAGRCETSEAFLGQWNLADANRPVPLQTAASFGTAIGFSPDGRLMSIGECASQDPAAAARLRIWNLETGRVMSSLPGLKGTIASASYSPDGRLLAAALGDPDEKAAGLVRVWEPGAGTQRYTLPSFAGKADAAFSSDGKWLVTVTSSKRRPGEIRLWNALTGEPVAQIGSAQDLENVTAMALSPDGQSLVTGHGDLAAPTSADKAKLKLWSLATRQLAGQLPTAHSAAITKIVFSRRGKLLATGDAAGNVRVWDFTTGKPLATQVPPQGRPITGLAFDRLGDRLATAADEKCVRVWHVDTAKALARMELAASAPTAVRFTPDGNFIVATTNTGGLVMWESASYRVRALLKAEGNPTTQEGHAGEVSCAVATQTGTRVITGGSDKTLRVWDLASRQLLATPFTFNQPVSCLAVAPSRKMLAVGTGRVKPAFEPGEVILCIQGEGQTQAVPQTLFQGIAVTGMAFTPDGNWLAVCAMAPDGPGSQGLRESAALVNLSTGKVQSLPAGDAQTVATSPDGRLLAVGRACGDIELWRLESPSASPPAIDPKKLPEMKKPLETKKPFDPKRITQDLPSGEVVTCAFWPGDSTKPAGGSAELFPARYGSEAAQPTGASPAPTWLQPQNSGQGLGPGAPAWQAPRNAAPAMPGLQNQPSPTAPVADLVPAAKPVVLQGHRGAVKSLAFSPDGKTLASGSEDYDAKVWDVSTGEELLTFKHNGAVDAVRFSADGKVLATADREPMHGGVRLWRAAPDEFIVGPNLQPIPSAGERTTHSGAPQPWQNTDPPTRYR